MRTSKVEVFISSSILYCIIFVAWNDWRVTGKEVAEMIFIGTFSSLILALMMNRITRLITGIVEKVVKK